MPPGIKRGISPIVIQMEGFSEQQWFSVVEGWGSKARFLAREVIGIPPEDRANFVENCRREEALDDEEEMML